MKKKNYSFLVIKSLINKIQIYLIIYIIRIKCEQECPFNIPIFNKTKNSCAMEYCTNEQFINEECIIANRIIKKQWMNEISIIDKSIKTMYPTYGRGGNSDILFETNKGNNEKIFYSIEKDGRGFMDEKQLNYIKYNSNNNLYNTYGNSALFTINGHKCLIKLSFYETIEIYDLVDKKITNEKIENIFGFNIKSYHNSLLRTKEENVFIYAYITSGNCLAMQKFKINSNEASNSIEIIKTLIEDEKTISKNSRRCLITSKQYIECLDMDLEQIFSIRLYDINLNFIKKFELEKNISPPKRAFSTYHEAIYLTNELSIFIYYNDISNHKAKPIAVLKKLENTNFLDISNEINKFILFNQFNYYFSDTENSFTFLNEHYFAFASITTFMNKHLIIALINLFSNKKTIRIHNFDIPLKDLYDIDYHSNLQSFYFNNFIGVQFVQLKNNNYMNTILLFSYANTSDPTTIYNIFEKYNKINNNTYTIKLSDYIKLENNIFCNVLTGITINSIPDRSTGILIQNSNLNEIKKGNIISLEDILSITYTTDLNSIKKGNYFIVFSPNLEEPDYQEFLNCQANMDYIGAQISINWNPDKFTGRLTKFKFTVGNCYENCGTCEEEGVSLDNQKCQTCIEGYYFEENTQNCYKTANEGYYFNKNQNIFSKCYKNCKTCDDINIGESVHNCLTCKYNYLLYNNTNCLNCKYLNYYTNYEQTSCIQFIPNGYYLNDTKYNTIDKCHKNCLACNGRNYDDNNMNCIYCDNENGFFFVENTRNCYKVPYEGYFLDEDFVLKKCYYMCKTCSAKPTYKSNGEIQNMNCDTCNSELGFFKVNSNSKNCEYKEKIREYYNELDNNYYPCYENCLTCFDKEVIDSNNVDMKCLTCDENNGFFLYMKNGNNCLNCKYQNKYLNIDENKCIDNIPKGYYLYNKTSNQIDSCYQRCETCSEKGISDNDMKCDSCSKYYIFENKNCIQNMVCPYLFYYKININDSDKLKEKNCLDKKDNCIDSLIFYYTHSNECLDNCPYDFIYSKGCKISNVERDLNLLFSFFKIEYEKGNLENFEKIFKFSQKGQNYFLIINIFPYSSDEHIINLQRGEEIQNIDNDGIFYYNSNKIAREEKIDLDECIEFLRNNSIINEKTKITMVRINLFDGYFYNSNYYYELFDDDNRLEKIDLSICYINNFIEKIDINNIVLPNITYREENINLLNIYKDQCYVFTSKDGADVLVEDRIIDYWNVLNNNSFNSNNNYKESSSINIYYSDLPDSSSNLCPPNCVLDKIDYDLNEYHCTCPFEENKITKLRFLKIRKNPKRNMESLSLLNSNSNIYVLKCINNISKNFKKNYILIIFTLLCAGYIACTIIYFVLYRQKYINTVDLATKNQKVFALSNSFRSGNLGNPPRKINNISRNSVNKTLKIMDSNDIKSSKNCQKPQSNNKVDIKKCVTLPSDYSNSIYTDLDTVDYNIALDKDKRNFFRIFLSISKKRQIFIYSFIKDHNILVLKVSLLILCLINYFMINVFFFNGKVIHKIYIDKGKYNFRYQIKYITLSALISCVFLYIVKFIFIFEKSPKLLIEVIKCIDASLIIIILLFIFYWVYIGSFCSVFINTQKHLIINFALTFVTCIIYEFILTLISCVIRIIALKKKKFPRLYVLSTFLVSLKK